MINNYNIRTSSTTKLESSTEHVTSQSIERSLTAQMQLACMLDEQYLYSENFHGFFREIFQQFFRKKEQK